MYEKELREKKNDLVTRAEGLLKKAEMEKRELTSDEAQELAEIRDDVRRIKETLEAKGFFDGEGRKDAPVEVEVEKKVEETRELETREAQERKAFEDYIRGRVNERAANLTPAQGSGQVLIPTTIYKEIIKKVYDISPILDRSQKFNVKGKLDIPYYNETGGNAITVAYAQEFVELTANVGGFTTIQLEGFLAGTLSLISRSLINNSQFDIVGFVVDEMAYHIHRFIEGQLLNGHTGTGASAGVTGLSTLTNTMTAGAATAITADEVIKLKDNIKDQFQNNAIWIMSPATRTALRLLKDEVGRYLLQDDITSPFGTTLLGKPIYVSDNMPNIGANNTAIYYGDMTGLATKFSEDMNIEVLREKYATQHAIGVVGWLEFDGKVIDAQKITALKMAATDPTTAG